MTRVVAPPATSARDVARHFIHLGASEEQPEYLSNLRLQKLLYYAQAWSLANRGRALFHEKIEAWTHGPVVRSVYSEYADWGSGSIDPADVPQTRLNATDRAFVESVWEAYKGYSALALREMTHVEGPWLEAYKGPNNGQKPGIVSEAAMKEYFAAVPA